MIITKPIPSITPDLQNQGFSAYGLLGEDVSLPTWPIVLPLAPLLDAYNETHKSLTKAVTTGNKSMLVRRVATRTQKPIKVAFCLTTQQVDYFETFFYKTLDGGAIRFTFQHPRTKLTIECTFDASQETAFTVDPLGSSKYWRINTQFLIWD